MTKKNNHLENRLISNSHNKVMRGRIALFGIGMIVFAISFIPIMRLRESGVITTSIVIFSLVPVVLYVMLGFLSLKSPKVSFLIGMVLVGIALLTAVVGANLLGVAINLFVMVILYNAYDGARILEKYQPELPEDDEILDSNLD